MKWLHFLTYICSEFRWKDPEFPTSEVEGFFLPRYVLQIHLALDSTLSMCHLFTLAIWGKRCASDEAACAACHPWKGPVWNEELSNFPDLVVGNPQWWVSGNKIKWLETQTWVPIVPEAKNASQAGFSRQLVLGWGGCWLLHAFIVLKPAHLPETPPFGPSSVLSWPSPL